MRLYLITLFTLSYFLSYGQKTQDLICWSSVDCLGIENFQGLDVADSICQSNGIERTDAMSSLIFAHKKVSFDSINHFRLVGYFDPNYSWINEDGSLLKHEQTHFNINQLVIARANRLLDSLFTRKIKIDYDSLANVIYTQSDSLQDIFDTQTWHGNFDAKNDEWSEKIISQLDQLNEFHIIYCDASAPNTVFQDRMH